MKNLPVEYSTPELVSFSETPFDCISWSDFDIVAVPTSICVTSYRDNFLVQVGRICETNFYRRGNKLVPHDSLTTLNDFNGISHEDRVLVYEVWEEWNYKYHLSGFIKAPESLVSTLKKYFSNKLGFNEEYLHWHVLCEIKYKLLNKYNDS